MNEREALVHDLLGISQTLAAWAMKEMRDGASPEDVRERLRSAVRVVEKERSHDAIHELHMKEFGGQ